MSFCFEGDDGRSYPFITLTCMHKEFSFQKYLCSTGGMHLFPVVHGHISHLATPAVTHVLHRDMSNYTYITWEKSQSCLADRPYNMCFGHLVIFPPPPPPPSVVCLYNGALHGHGLSCLAGSVWFCRVKQI